MSFVFAATRQHQLRSGMLQCRFTRSFYARNLTHYGCQMWEKLIKLTSLSTQQSDLAWFTVCQCCKQKHKLDGSQSFCIASKVMKICLAASLYANLSYLESSTAISSPPYERFRPLQKQPVWTGWTGPCWLTRGKGRMDTHNVVRRVADAIFQNRSAASPLNRGVRGEEQKDDLPHDQLAHLFAIYLSPVTFLVSPNRLVIFGPLSGVRSPSLGWAQSRSRREGLL